MPLVSKTVEVDADAAAILGIVADFESFPQWNDEVKAVYILARYHDGRPSQLRIDTGLGIHKLRHHGRQPGRQSGVQKQQP